LKTKRPRKVRISNFVNISEIVNHQDDEYQDVGVYEPKIYLTTSRDPSSRLIQFSKEIAKIFPNTLKQNRGNHKIGEIVEACKADEFTDLVVLHETRGEPDAMLITHFPFGPTIYFTLSNVVMRHDLKQTVPISEQAPHLIFHNFTTKLGDRVTIE
jgi:U3 small nucleolar ribonucleoprotein protein IMP4